MSLRAGANHPTHLPFIKRPPKPLLLGYQGGDADDETTRRRGALDVATHFMRVAFRRVVPVQRQRVNTLPRAGACSGDRLNTLAGVHRITPSSIVACGWRQQVGVEIRFTGYNIHTRHTAHRGAWSVACAWSVDGVISPPSRVWCGNAPASRAARS